MIRFAIIETLPAAVDLMFEIVSLRYEQGAVIITSKWTYKDWPEMFNNEDTLSLWGADGSDFIIAHQTVVAFHISAKNST